MYDENRTPRLDASGIETLHEFLKYTSVSWDLLFINHDDESVIQKLIDVNGVSVVLSFNLYVEHILLYMGGLEGGSLSQPKLVSGESYDLGTDFPDLIHWTEETLLDWAKRMLLAHIAGESIGQTPLESNDEWDFE